MRKEISAFFAVFLLFASMTSSALAGAQEEWIARYKSDDNTYGMYSSGYVALAAADGSVYSVGIYRPSSPPYTYDWVVLKYDSEGNLLWDKVLEKDRYNSVVPTNTAVLDPYENVIVVGLNRGVSTSFVLRMSPDGGILWEKEVDADALWWVRTDAQGNIYAMGKDSVLGGVIVKYSPDGVLIWQKTMAGATFDSLKIKNGTIYLGGSSSSAPALWTMDLNGNQLWLATSAVQINRGYHSIDVAPDGSVYATASWNSIVVEKFSSSGILLWSKNELSYGRAAEIETDSEGNLYFGGRYNPDGTFGRYLVGKYSAEGDILWIKYYYAYGESDVYGIAVDEYDNVYSVGEFGYCPGQFKTMKHSPNGQVLWNFTKNLYFTCASINYGFDIALNPEGGVYVTGYTTAQGQWARLTIIKYTETCSGPPTLELTSASPLEIWPPNGKLQPVTLTGNVSVTENCTVKTSGYQIDDEYGKLSGSGPLSLDRYGNFSLTVDVDARRDGADKDGRSYTISVSVSTEGGEAAESVVIKVLHDMRK